MAFLQNRFPGGLFPRFVALFPLLFPLYLFRGTLFGIPVTLPELVLGFLFLAFLWTRPVFRLQEWKLWPVFLFLLAAGISVWLVADFSGQIKALGILKGWILAPLLYFCMARTVFREKPSLIPLALRALLVSGLILAWMGLMQVFTGNYLTPDGRASGPFESANYLSLYLGPLVVYAILACMEATSRRERAFFIFSSVLGGSALVFTQSYAVFIAVFAVLVAALLLTIRRNHPRWFWRAWLAMVVLGLGLVVSQMGTEKFEQFLEFSQQSSSSVRIQVYQVSLRLLAEHPFLGLGLGQYEIFYQTQAETILGLPPFESTMLHPHNIVLAFWLNMGVLGLVAFIWMLGKALLWLTEKDSKQRHLAAFMLLTLLIHGLFDTPYFKNDLAFQFWLFMAILL